MSNPKFECYGAWARLATDDGERIVYTIVGQDFCDPKHTIAIHIPQYDFEMESMVLWDSIYNRMYNAFVEIHRGSNGSR